jgi:hypothetical protein
MLWPVVFVIIESSALYAFGVFAVLATFLSGSYGQYIAIDAIVPLVVSRTVRTLSSSRALILSCGHFSGHRLLSDRAADPFPCQFVGCPSKRRPNVRGNVAPAAWSPRGRTRARVSYAVDSNGCSRNEADAHAYVDARH